MATDAIPKDAIIADILMLLRDKDRYLSGVFHNMILFRKQHGSAVVRIGTSGGGRAPHYRIQPEETSLDADMREIFAETPEEEERERERTKVVHYTAYLGTGHSQAKWGKGELKEPTWSGRWMTIDEVEDLIADVRGIKRKPK